MSNDTTAKWIGTDSVTSYGPDVSAPEIDYDKPPKNRYGELIDIHKRTDKPIKIHKVK